MKKRILAVMLAALMAAVSITGCSGGNDAVSQGNDNGGNNASSEKKEDRALRLRLTASLASLDWEQTTNIRDMKVWHQMYEGLYGMDEANNGYYKELAKDVQLSEDQMVYTVTLQDGVKFQNGESLKSSDVVFSYNRAIKNPRFNYLTSMIEKVESVDDQTVKITLNKPYAPIDHTFFCIKITSEKEVTEQGDKFGTIPNKAGTGPYCVSEYDISTGVKLQAFEGYWRGSPSIKNIEYIIISDDAAAVIAYENNELDYLEEAPLSDWDSLKQYSGENNAMVKGNNIMFMAINYLRNDILANDKVREAIFYAVNKSDINLAVSNGYGVEATQYMPSDYVATSPVDGFETYAYDPEKAKVLLAEAGFQGGVDVGIISAYGTSSSENAKMAQVIQANFEQVGIKAGVTVAEYATVSPKLYAQDYDICLFYDSGNYDFNNIRQQLHSESEGMYVVKYKDGKFDWKRMEELVDLGASTSDTSQRLSYYTELWSMVMDSKTILPCLHRPVPIVWSKDLNIGTPVPTYYKVRTFSWK